MHKDSKGRGMTQEDVQADGYYGDEDVSSEELDLSFLDEDETTKK